MKETQEKDYSYLKFNMPFKKALNEALVKAVRVTSSVTSKIGNNFRKNFTVEGIEGQQVQAINQHLEEVKATQPFETTEDTSSDSTEGGRYLISKTVDETEENLIELANKLKALETQKKVVATVKRMALYTKELIELVKRVTSKWFGFLTPTKNVSVVAEKVEAKPTPEIVPFDWNIVPIPVEKQVVATKDEPVAPIVEPVVESKPEVTPVVPTIEPAKTTLDFNYDFSVPVFNQMEEKTPEVEPVSGFVVPSFSSEDSIVNSIKNELSNGFELPKEEAPSNNALMARMHMIGNEISDLNRLLSKSNDDLKNANVKIGSLNDEIKAYKTVNKDLSDRISILIGQAEALSKDKIKLMKVLEEMKKGYDTQLATMEKEHQDFMFAVDADKKALITAHELEVENLKREAKDKEEKMKAEFVASMKTVYEGMQKISDAVKSPSRAPEVQEEAYDFMDKGYAKAA